MGSSKSSSATIGYRYYMTLQMALGRGPLDEVVEIKVGDKTAWPFRDEESTAYDTTCTDDRVTSIDAPELFGGDSAEGGISGSLTVLMGKSTQTYPTWVKTLLGGNVPDFRGVATAVFDGLICSLNPYPKTWKYRVRRTLKGWDGDVWQPDLALITLTADSGTSDDADDDDDNDTEDGYTEATDYTIKAMNPAHIIYECVTNRLWGRGYDRSRINDTSWLEAAETLYNEKFGMCIAWKRDGTLQDFVGNVLDHIGGTLYVSRETGLLELKLIRDDYDVDDLPLFDKNSGLISLEEPETASMTDAVGEVIVTYHDPVTDQDLQVRAQNLAVLQSSEGTNSKKVTYEGIPTAALASRVAQRDLKAQSAEVSRYKVILDRRAWRLYPGAVFRVTDTDKGIENIVLRAGDITDTSITDGKITCEAVIDVFGMSSVAFASTETSAYTKVSKSPQVLTRAIAQEVTYHALVQTVSAADRAYIEDTDAYLTLAAGRTNYYQLSYSILTQAEGETSMTTRGTATFVPSAKLSGAVSFYNDTLAFTDGFDMGVVTDGMLIAIGDEFMVATDIVVDDDGTTGTITVGRGVLDSIPMAHADGAAILFIGTSFKSDEKQYASGETVSVKLLSNTSSGRLAEASATAMSVEMTSPAARHVLPYPPGAVFVVTGTSWVPCWNTPAADATSSIQWAHRDRISQEDQLVSHFESNVGPEDGTLYELVFKNSSGTTLRSVDGIADNYYNLTSADTDLVGTMTVTLRSYRVVNSTNYYSKFTYEFSMTRTL